jgi:hypothetical protein
VALGGRSAGTGIVVHNDDTVRGRWNRFRESNPLFQRTPLHTHACAPRAHLQEGEDAGVEALRQQYEERDTVLFHYLHRVHDSICAPPTLNADTRVTPQRQRERERHVHR